jgi:hypothetical protein
LSKSLISELIEKSYDKKQITIVILRKFGRVTIIVLWEFCAMWSVIGDDIFIKWVLKYLSGLISRTPKSIKLEFFGNIICLLDSEVAIVDFFQKLKWNVRLRPWLFAFCSLSGILFLG